MGATAMKTINRAAVIVIPASPFLDWLHRADPTSAALSLEDLRGEFSIYLLPEYDTDDEALEYLRAYCTEIFEEELAGWYRVRTGDYRVRFRVEGDTVVIDHVGHRSTFYEG